MTADMSVDFLGGYGNDLTVVNAARVSFDKTSDWMDGCPGLLVDKDISLINFLAKNGHWTPFSHPQMSFRIKVPIAIRNQLDKSRVGLAINEVSRRYVSSKPDVYTPPKWRKAAANVKQGSGDAMDYAESTEIDYIYIPAIQTAVNAYEAMLQNGVCPEQARFVLPVGMMTEFVWTGSLAAFARVYNLRTDPHAQAECHAVAKSIGDVAGAMFPYSWRALTNG